MSVFSGSVGDCERALRAQKALSARRGGGLAARVGERAARERVENAPVATGLRVAIAWPHLPVPEAQPALALLRRIVAILWKMMRGGSTHL